MEEVVIDGSNAILGRLASHVAKLLLEGKKVVVLNSEKIAVSGDPTKLIQFYKDTVLNVKTHFSHKWRPKRARSPNRLFKKTVSGMLPKNNRKGEDALKRLIVYVGVPKEYKNKEAIKIPEVSIEKLGGKYTTLQVIAENMGWKVNVVE